MVEYLQRHAQVFFFTLGRLYRRPIASLLTVLVIGITLALPAGLHLLFKNISSVSYSWEGTVRASLFLHNHVEKAAGEKMATEIGLRAEVSDVLYISREESMAEFRRLSGFGEALDLLEKNPLPAVIMVTPSATLTPQEIETLIAEFNELPEVEQAKLDQKWLQRLYAVLAIVERGVLVIATLLALAVIITVGNTIRLDIFSQREEIKVMKLVGASDAFIRRPFLYTGFWYGLLGGLIAWIFVSAAMAALSSPTASLSALYDSAFELKGLGLLATVYLFGAGTLLGLLGSWWTVGRHLSQIQPA